MTHVVFTYRIRRDHTGVEDLMPVILTEFGPLVPLLRYMLKSNIGRSSQAKLILAVGLLLDFMEACWRRFKIEPPCRLNFEPGLLANL